jgi:hypothetical protein
VSLCPGKRLTHGVALKAQVDGDRRGVGDLLFQVRQDGPQTGRIRRQLGHETHRSRSGRYSSPSAPFRTPVCGAPLLLCMDEVLGGSVPHGQIQSCVRFFLGCTYEGRRFPRRAHLESCRHTRRQTGQTRNQS